MQTFFPYKDPQKIAQCLDTKRLGKQRVEAIQIAKACLYGGGWKSHPIVKMWKGYEKYLLKIYLWEMMVEWVRRGYNNYKCLQEYLNIIFSDDNLFFDYEPIKKPKWINNNRLIRSYRSNLVRKDPAHYRKYFPEVPDSLEYVWYK